jgi:hypothetical protein
LIASSVVLLQKTFFLFNSSIACYALACAEGVGCAKGERCEEGVGASFAF